MSIRIFPSAFFHPHFIIRIFPSAIFYPPIRHPPSAIRHPPSAIRSGLYRDPNWTAQSTNLKANAGKLKSVFVIRAALWAEKLGRCLENCRSWKNTFGKLVVAVNLEAIWFEFWMKGALVTMEVSRSSVVGYSHISLKHILAAIQLAVSCAELFFARRSVFKRTGTFASESKVMCLF